MTAPILVTGASGNVGTPLVSELLGLGGPVRVAARQVDGARAAFGGAVEVVPFDFERPEGQAYTPTGPAAVTYDAIAEVLTRELGRPIRYADPGVLRYFPGRSQASGASWMNRSIVLAVACCQRSRNARPTRGVGTPNLKRKRARRGARMR